MVEKVTREDEVAGSSPAVSRVRVVGRWGPPFLTIHFEPFITAVCMAKICRDLEKRSTAKPSLPAKVCHVPFAVGGTRQTPLPSACNT